MDNFDFSEEEIQEQLAILGYKNIPKHRLREFKQDLDEMMRYGEWKTLAPLTQRNSTVFPTAQFEQSPPAFVKEKVSQCNFKGSAEGFFLHAASDREVLTTYQNGDYKWQQGCCDSYARHSVAPKLQLPPGGPGRLQVEPDLEDTLHPQLTDSCTSSPDTQGRCFIKRKVLRKYKGQSLVCDESLYSENSDHTHLSRASCTMYKMYNPQWDEGSDDDEDSLSSSFWSDGEKQENEEEEVELVINEEESKPAADCSQEASAEKQPELNNQGSFCKESLEGTGDDDDYEEEECCSSSSESEALSLMTSGYGTYRPGEQDGADHTITELDRDSQRDLSEVRDDGENSHSLCSFGGFDIDRDTDPPSVTSERDQHEAKAFFCGGGGLHEEVGGTIVKPDDTKQVDEETLEYVHAENKDMTSERSEEQLHCLAAMNKQGKQHEVDVEGLQEAENNGEREVEESEDLDESSSNKDIKFINSKADFSWTMYDQMCDEWEGNLRQKTDAVSCMEERLAELHLSTSAQRDSETESEDMTSQSDTPSSSADGISLSAFESYIRGMVQTQSDGAFRPKPKSFIRPVMSQQTLKKTDPVTKYFQYKQLWDMFKLPGEKDRRALRQEIKEQLAYQPPPPKPRRVYVPNTYVVPTEKKRSALRWEVRNDLANGLLPHKFSYRF